MKQEGPPIESLTRRLAECPPEFLATPRIGSAGKVHVAAVVSDLLRELGCQPLIPAQAAVFQGKQNTDRNRLSLVLVACWLLHDPWFRQAGLPAGQPAAVHQLLSHDLAELAGTSPAAKYVADADRREELARLCLLQHGLRPAGESIAQAEDRLATLNAAERHRVVLAARQAEERSRAIRAAMQRKADEEANAKAMRE